MRFAFLSASLLIAVTCLFANASRVTGADEGGQVKILARGSWPHLPTHLETGNPGQHQWVIRAPEELAKVAGKGGLTTVPKALGAVDLDFAKQMLVVVEDGTQPLVGVSGGGAPSAPSVIDIPRIAMDAAGKTMTVNWRLVPRGKDSPIITRALLAIVVDRFDGDVKFDKLPTKTDASKEELTSLGKSIPIRARAFWPDGWPPEAPRKEWVIRSADELIDRRLRAPEPVLIEMRERALAAYVKALKVAKIDFGSQMIVGVSGGVQAGGSSVEVLRAEVDDRRTTMTVHWRIHPATADRKDGEISHPSEVLLIEQFAGKVQFVEEQLKK